ncbi:MAG: Trm112 family protein [Rhizobiaceae bacterium]|jgi:uncharacterized protein YbaR (Trm112 family)|nr:Trm112 family protein [Rhizobiaceae bacterium]
MSADGSAADSHPQRRIDPKMLELLVCPLTKGPLDLDEDGEWLTSRKAKLRFPVRDGIPILLADEAQPIGD